MDDFGPNWVVFSANTPIELSHSHGLVTLSQLTARTLCLSLVELGTPEEVTVNYVQSVGDSSRGANYTAYYTQGTVVITELMREGNSTCHNKIVTFPTCKLLKDLIKDKLIRLLSRPCMVQGKVKIDAKVFGTINLEGYDSEQSCCWAKRYWRKLWIFSKVNLLPRLTTKLG